MPRQTRRTTTLALALAAASLLLVPTGPAAGAPLRAASDEAFTGPGVASATAPVSTSTVVVPMTLPVVGSVTYTDTFLACRSGCTRRHLGQDLMGKKMLPLVAAFTGKVTYLQRETSVGGGNYVSVQSASGWTANYIHVNNDTPGTDDGKGTAMWSFMPGVKVGATVFRGQHIGWLGDSGNAESTSPHLHFELRKGDAWSGTVYNPKPSLDAAPRLSTPSRSGPHQSGELVRAGSSAVYLLDRGTRRGVPASALAANGWTDAHVVAITWDELNSYPYGGNVALRDGHVVTGPDGRRWAVTGGSRREVSDADVTAMGLDPAQLRTVGDDALAATPLAAAGAPVPGRFREGAVVREEGGKYAYAVRAGALHVLDLTSAPTWGWAPGDIAVLPVGALSGPGAPALGAPALIRDGHTVSTPDGRVSLIVGGVRRPVPDSRALTAYGWAAKPRRALSEAYTAAVPVGTALP